MFRVLTAASVVLLLAACAPASTVDAPSAATATEAETPRNLILFIADGFGPASATMGSVASRSLGRPFALDTGLIGSVETSPTDSGRVTDSAAGATAFSCGLKTYNGAIATTPERVPCRTVLQAAEERGMATGLVATSRITHATPASFAAHVPQRSMEAQIASQYLTSGVEVLFGGGRRFFDDRNDDRNLIDEFRAAGATVALDRPAFDALVTTPAVALFTPSHLAFEVDRDPAAEPSLAEMTTRALHLLAEAGGDDGFFLMVESSRIDHAGHGNDPVGHLHDILAYDAAIAAALEWAAEDGQTLIVATSDHETGGMTLARDGPYFWDPEPILNATMSQEAISIAISRGADPQTTIRDGLALDSLDAGIAEAIREAVMLRDRDGARGLFDGLISKPAGIGWTTGGHTAVDVGLYAWGPGADAFRGHMPNDAVGRKLFTVLGLSR